MTPSSVKAGFSVDKLKVESSDGRNFVLLVTFSFIRPSGEVVTVPMGATSDGASTPQAMWNVLPPFGTYWRAAFLHDWLYRGSDRPKGECDTILKEAMESLGVGWLDRDSIYEGVAIGGEESFRADRAAQQAAIAGEVQQ